jgi:cell division protein ZapA
MPSYNLNVLGLDVSFKAEADQKRVAEAKNLLEKRFKQLDFRGRQISREKLLIYLALGLADDLLQSNQKLSDQEARLAQLLTKINEAAQP